MTTTDKFTRFNIVGRSGATLEAYLSGPLRDYYLSREYVYGLAERKNELFAKQSKAAGWMFGLTTLLAFFDSVVGTNVSVLGVSFLVKPEFASAICFLAASSFCAVVQVFIDNLIIDNYLATIGRHVKMYSFGLYILPKSAINLWAEAATPRYFGHKSGNGHKVTFFGIFVVILLAGIAISLYPTLVCGSNILQTFQKAHLSWAEFGLAFISLLTLLASWLLALLSTLKFKYFDADFHEADSTPTPEFIAKVKAEQENFEKIATTSS
jgi:hypothetical protein